MGDLYSNTTWQINASDYDLMESEIPVVSYVTMWVVICIGLPLTVLAICALYSLVRNDHVAPIYVINLLISDLLQLCCMIVWATEPEDVLILYVSHNIYDIGLMASVGFMMCVAIERYLVVAWPLWYRFKRTIKTSAAVCVVVWISPFVYIVLINLTSDFLSPVLLFSIFLLLPFPFLIFSLSGTLKSLSAATLVSSEEKCRIVGALILVLCNYTLLFLPTIIWLLAEETRGDIVFGSLSLTIIRFSPLADLVLYVFMRKGAFDKLLVCLHCCKLEIASE